MILIQPDDPKAPDVVALLRAHLTFMNSLSAPEDVHALDVEALCAPAIQFFSARDGDLLVGVGALKRLDADHFEIKSMHTAAAARGKGIARLIVEHLLQFATESGARRVSLETGTMEGMKPARDLYGGLRFVECEPFGDYWVTDASTCMTLELPPPEIHSP